MENPFFKENDQLVYVVWYNDCEPYEDNFQCIDAIFLTWEEAEDHISTRANKKEDPCRWVYSHGESAKVREPYWIWEDPDYYDSMFNIEIWNVTTGKRVLYDNKHIFLVEDRTNNTSYNEGGIGSINPSEADTE